MKKEEKLLKNKNMGMPSEAVLDKARSELHYDGAKRKIGYKRIVACASVVLVILIVAICIPLMIPHNSAMPYVTDDMLTVEPIGSIADYNAENKTEILHFDVRNTAYSYKYEDKVVFLEETSSFDGDDIVILIEIRKNTVDCMFQKPVEFYEKLISPDQTVIGKFTASYSVGETSYYASFTDDDYIYYIKISGENAEWESFLQKLIK